MRRIDKVDLDKRSMNDLLATFPNLRSVQSSRPIVTELSWREHPGEGGEVTCTMGGWKDRKVWEATINRTLGRLYRYRQSGQCRIHEAAQREHGHYTRRQGVYVNTRISVGGREDQFISCRPSPEVCGTSRSCGKASKVIRVTGGVYRVEPRE